MAKFIKSGKVGMYNTKNQELLQNLRKERFFWEINMIQYNLRTFQYGETNLRKLNNMNPYE